MDSFFPFIYEQQKKKQIEPEQLYIEIEPPRIEQREEKEETEPSYIVIIEL